MLITQVSTLPRPQVNDSSIMFSYESKILCDLGDICSFLFLPIFLKKYKTLWPLSRYFIDLLQGYSSINYIITSSYKSMRGQVHHQVPEQRLNIIRSMDWESNALIIRPLL